MKQTRVSCWVPARSLRLGDYVFFKDNVPASITCIARIAPDILRVDMYSKAHEGHTCTMALGLDAKLEKLTLPPNDPLVLFEIMKRTNR